MHPTFRSGALEGQFRSEGFAQLDVLPRSDALALREAALSKFYAGRGKGGSSSTETLAVEVRRALHDFVATAMEPPTRKQLVEHRSFTSSIVVKQPGDDSAVHRDWTFVDESYFRTLSVWMPLQDVDDSSGPLLVVPRSHRSPTAIRTNPGLITDPTTPTEETQVPVSLKAGAAVAFDHALYHGSPPNASHCPRVTLVLALAPAKAMLRHYWRRPDGTIEQYEISDNDFFRRCRFNVPPSGPGVTLVGEVNQPAH